MVFLWPSAKSAPPSLGDLVVMVACLRILYLETGFGIKLKQFLSTIDKINNFVILF